MSTPFSLHIIDPLMTRAGKTPRRRKYEVHYSGSKTNLAEFCRRAEISLCALISRTKSWLPGEYHEQFVRLVRAMKANRAIGKYQHKSQMCPSCGHQYTSLQGTQARRRARRDASPEGSTLRSMPPEYFGEQANDTRTDNSPPPVAE